MNLNHLSRFEQLAQQLLEGSFGRLFGSQLLPADIATRLATTMELRFQTEHPDSWVDGSYQVCLHPEDFKRLQVANSQLHEHLAEYLVTLAAQAGRPLSVTPVVQLVADSNIKRNQVLTRAVSNQTASGKGAGNTQVRSSHAASTSLRKLEELGAFVIIAGKRHVPLDQPLITVGRQLDSDIVIDNPSVSRRHAQLRWRYGRFVLYDLGGRQSTSVNGRPVTEHVLQAGDVILLSTASLVYGEDPVERGAEQAVNSKQDVLDEKQESSGTTRPLYPGETA